MIIIPKVNSYNLGLCKASNMAGLFSIFMLKPDMHALNMYIGLCFYKFLLKLP